jgi:predicted ATP-dependent endonuclease of OLD family
MFLSELTIKNFRMFGQGENELRLQLMPGLTALVGENDSGKSAIIDAIRYALQTRDQGFIRIQPEDLHIPESGPPTRNYHVASGATSPGRFTDKSRRSSFSIEKGHHLRSNGYGLVSFRLGRV